MQISPMRRFVALSLGVILGITACVVASLSASAEPKANKGQGRCRQQQESCEPTGATTPSTTTSTTMPTTTSTTAPVTPTWSTVAVPAAWAYATNTGGGCPVSTSASQDVTDRLNQLLNDRTQVPDGSTVQFLANGCYRLDRTARVVARNGLTFDGRGATFQRFSPTPPELLWPAGNPHWSFEGGSRIALSNMRVVGLNTVSDIDMTTVRAQRMFEPEKFGAGCGAERCFEYAFGFKKINGVTLTNLSADAVYGDGLLLGGEHASTSLTTDVVVTNMTIDRNGRQGVAIASTDRVVLDGVKILHSRATGFDFEVNALDGSISNIEIRNSYVNANTVAFANGGVGARGVYIHDNHVRYSLPSRPWISVPDQATYAAYPRRDWRIVRNTVTSVSEETPGIGLVNITNVEISGNVAFERPAPIARADAVLPAVRLTRAQGTVIIRGNDFTGNTTVYSADAATGPVMSCGNRLVALGAFDQTAPC